MLMSTYESRLSSLREKLKADGLDGFIVPISDEHMSEYVGSYAQRLEWLTGFRGSAGSAIVLQNAAAIFTDGRYTIQVRDQVDGKLYEYVGTFDQDMLGWLREHAQQGMKIGYDGWLHTRDWTASLNDALKARGASAVAVDSNPIDAIWDSQPARSDAKLTVQPLEYAGKSHDEKRADIAKWLESEGLDATVVNALDSVAWLFNIRSDDITHTPVPLAHAIVHSDGHAELFVAPEKLTSEVRAHLGNHVTLHDYDAFADELAMLKGKKVGVDPERAAAAIFKRLGDVGADISRKRDPSVLAKAIKNATEISGHRAAQARDGAALSRFLHWFSVEAPKGGHDELSVAAKLQEFREQNPELKDLSFDTISGASSNGALCHYKVSEETNKPIEMDNALSGRQWRAVSRRHHRCHPHDGGRHPYSRDAHPLHAGFAGPYRARLRGLSQGHGGRTARRAGAAVSVGRRRRLRARHRPRRRQLSGRARGAAAHRQLRRHERAAGSRHDLFE